MKSCPCCSQKPYESCCGLYLEAQQIPETPEALMRSRYTAYSQANIEYIKKTMRGQPLLGYNELEAKIWASHAVWLGLEVLETSLHPKKPNTGYVEFIARLRSGNDMQIIHERSEFEKYQGRWFYKAAHKPRCSKTSNKHS
ncbi:YchJ family protein [Legionella spiritensis]|uniref:YchJ family protein n=1 Tax=Legionella spiritensis TaxID=452 RepID=UPI000F6C3105|nr:YchJ family metal-binding protein [Legionella spiritensis]VEG90653.1 putative SEC-C motif domain protein [Legionella spiritensis]